MAQLTQENSASSALRGSGVIEKSTNVAPTTQQDHGHLILWIVDKRIRTWRKKLEKIQALEEKVAVGAKINDQQAAVLQNKEPSKVVLAELQKVRALLAEEAEKLEANGQVTPASTQQISQEVQAVEDEATVVPETIKNDAFPDGCHNNVEDVPQDSGLDAVVELFQCSRLFQPFLPGSEDIREEFLKSQAGKVSASDLDALQFACSLVDGSGNPFGASSLSDRVSEAMKHARAFIEGSEKELTYAVTYRRVREIVNACLTSSMFGTAPSPEPETSIDVPHINFMVEDMTATDLSNQTI